MTKEEKELLIKDLCGRLPYNVKGIITYNGDKDIFTVKGIHNDNLLLSECEACKIEDFKPYLRPLSSMTDEEEAEIANIIEGIYDFTFRTEELLEMISMQKTFPMASIDWFHENGFDIRGLIQKGLAIEAPEVMYNN